MARKETPVLIGVGDFKNRSKDLRTDGQDEPLQLMLQAITNALRDTGLTRASAEVLQASIDSVDVVRPWSWPYPDAAALLADKLGVNAKHTFVSPHGGNNPAKMLDEASRRIARGDSKVALVAGGESLDSLQRYIKAQKFPPPGWSPIDPSAGFVTEGLKPPSENARNRDEALKGLHRIGAPIQVYPLYENALRAARGESFSANHAASTKLYTDFAKIAAGNEYSWSHGAPAATAETIGTVGAKNRMICLPYPLLMNAFNTVNIAGALLVTSLSYARALGVPEERIIYPLGGAGTAEEEHFWLRRDFHSAPAIEESITAALAACGVCKEDVDVYDFYSCFPIVPKLAALHLGLPLTGEKPLSLLGGLTSFGGAGNNYSMHAISAMVRELRGKKATGLILANGGVLSYQHVVLLSSTPGKEAYPERAPLRDHVDVYVPALEEQPEGEAIVETYTVDFGKDNQPQRGHVIGRLVGSGKRFVSNSGDAKTLRELCQMEDGKEIVGRRGWVSGDPSKKGRNLFVFEKGPSL